MYTPNEAESCNHTDPGSVSKGISRVGVSFQLPTGIGFIGLAVLVQ